MAERPGDSTGVDGIGYDDLAAFPPHPGTKAGRKLKSLGQTSNRAGASVADQDCGTVAIGALAAGASTTVTITNSLITTLSLIRVQPMNVGPNATAGRGLVCSPRVPTSGACVVDVTSLQAIGSGDYELHFWITN